MLSSALTYSKIYFTKKRISTSCPCFTNKKDNTAPIDSPLKNLLNDAASFDDVSTQDMQQQWATLPYLKGTKIRKQGDYFRKPKQDPRNSSIILFPGQGSQYVGMAKDLLKFPMAKDLFDLANYLLGYDLLKLCLEGPKEKLDQTRYCQLAVVVTSLAAIERLKEERPDAIDNCVGTAGFSVGELTSLIFAGALDFERGMYCCDIIIIQLCFRCFELRRNVRCLSICC